jgi:hypothetical protein
MARASAFGWLATCSGVGGTRPPRLAPGGGNGKGGDPIPCCRRLVLPPMLVFAWISVSISLIDSHAVS